MKQTTTIVLDDSERDSIASSLNRIDCFEDNPLQAVKEARLGLMRTAPDELLYAIEEIRTNPDAPGMLLVKNGPLPSEIPSTPNSGSGQDQFSSFESHLFLLGVASLLGIPYVFRDQKAGQFPASIYPKQGMGASISNAGFTVPLGLHTEDPVVPSGLEPIATLLFCLRQDPSNSAETLVVDGRSILRELDFETKEELQKPNFAIGQSESFAGGLTETKSAPVFTGTIDRPALRTEFNQTRCQGPRAKVAYQQFKDSAERNLVRYKAEAGDLCILCQRRTLHGRGVFVPDFEREPGSRRWLLRVGVLADGYQVRDWMPSGYRVIEAPLTVLRDRILVAGSGVCPPVDKKEIDVRGLTAAIAGYDRMIDSRDSEGGIPDVPRLELALCLARDIVHADILINSTLFRRLDAACRYVYNELMEVITAWHWKQGSQPELDLNAVRRALGSKQIELSELISLIQFPEERSNVGES